MGRGRCRTLGVHFVSVDPALPLEEQEGHPFDVILHKIPEADPGSRAWEERLDRYARANPAVAVLDTPERVHQLRNRETMLRAVREIELHTAGGVVAAPRQLVVGVGGSPKDVLEAVRAKQLRLPLLAKPLKADGSETSHALALLHDERALERVALGECVGLEPPCVLQEFVDHGGALFKVYVVGNNVRTTRRRSLPDLHNVAGVRGSRSASEGLEMLGRLSCIRPRGEQDASAEIGSSRRGVGLGDGEDEEHGVGVEEPERGLVRSIAMALRSHLGMQLFNFDLIRCAGELNRFLVIDINYFPGYAKMPGYETVFAEFLQSFGSGGSKGVSLEGGLDRA